MHRRQVLAALAGGLALEGLQLALGAGLGSVGLGACGGSTSGQLVDVTTRVSSTVALGEPWTTPRGFSVVLRRLRVAIASLRLLEEDEAAPLAARLGLIREAQAHPGHVEDAGVMAEQLSLGVIDFAAGDWQASGGHGIEGPVSAGYLAFDDQALDGVVIELEGEVATSTEPLLFHARVRGEELMSDHGAPEIWGCPVDGASVEDDARLALIVDPRLWLADLRFEMLPMMAEGVELSGHDGSRLSLLAALRAPNAWRFTLDAP
ncbi:MAG: hypothetical protein R3B72_16235 [Polyangiaceae bacterium]